MSRSSTAGNEFAGFLPQAVGQSVLPFLPAPSSRLSFRPFGRPDRSLRLLFYRRRTIRCRNLACPPFASRSRSPTGREACERVFISTAASSPVPPQASFSDYYIGRHEHLQRRLIQVAGQTFVLRASETASLDTAKIDRITARG